MDAFLLWAEWLNSTPEGVLSESLIIGGAILVMAGMALYPCLTGKYPWER